MSWQQLREWAVFASHEPIGFEALDLQMAATRRVMAGTVHDRKRGPLPGIERFLLRPPPRKRQSPQEMLEVIMAAGSKR